MTVICLKEEKENRTPHNVGDAKCIMCGHKWVAICPVGTQWLECSECHSMKGLLIYPCERKDRLHWNCNCGNDLFHMTPDGTYCPNCGEWQKGF